MDDEQSDLFADIHLVDRWRAVACVDHRQPRSATDETDGEDVSARLFWDIRALTYLRGNEGDPERPSEAPVRAVAPDEPPSCDPSATAAEDYAGRDASVSVPDLKLFRMRRAAAPRVLTFKRLRIGCASCGPTHSTCIKARAPPKDRKPHPARGPPQARRSARPRFSNAVRRTKDYCVSADANSVWRKGQAEAGRT